MEREPLNSGSISVCLSPRISVYPSFYTMYFPFFFSLNKCFFRSLRLFRYFLVSLFVPDHLYLSLTYSLFHFSTSGVNKLEREGESVHTRLPIGVSLPLSCPLHPHSPIHLLLFRCGFVWQRRQGSSRKTRVAALQLVTAKMLKPKKRFQMTL